MILPALLLALSAHAAPKNETLWHEWYLVSQKGAGLSYFEETAEKRPADHQLAVTQKWVEKMAARSEVYIGSVADESSLAPVAFFVERKGPKPYKIDARANGKKLDITFKPGTPDLMKSSDSAPLTAQTYLSSFLSTYLARQAAKGKGAYPFTAIVEDAGEMNVEVKSGTAEVGGTEKKIGKETCREAIVQFNGQVQEWWVTKQGKACLVNFPESGTKMELTTELAAKKALKEGK